MKARASGGAAGSASAGAGEKSVLGLQGKMEKITGCTAKGEPQLYTQCRSTLTCVNMKSVSSNMCSSPLVFLLLSWFHATSVTFTWQDTGPLLGIAIRTLTLQSFTLCECWSKTECLGPYINWHLELYTCVFMATPFMSHISYDFWPGLWNVALGGTLLLPLFKTCLFGCRAWMTLVYHGVILLVHQRNPSPASKQTCLEKRQICWRRTLLKEWVSWPSRRVGTVTQAPHKCMRSRPICTG